MNLSKRTDPPDDASHQQELEDARWDYEETCQAIADGLADIEAGRTVSFEEAWALREAEKARRKNAPQIVKTN